MKIKVEIQVEHACDGCVLDFGDCKGNPTFLSQVLEEYGIDIGDLKHADIAIRCPERLVPPDDDDGEA